MADEEQENNETLEAKYMICPCCGKPTLPRPVKPNDALTEHWLACMVTATPFTHTYPMYNGKITMTICADSADTDSKLDLLAAIFDSIAARQDLMETAQINIPQLKAMARICIHIVDVKMSLAGRESRTFTPQACVQAALDKLYPLRADIMSGKEMPEFRDVVQEVTRMLTSSDNVTSLPPSVMVTAVETHLQLNNILMNTGFDKTFWDGIELA